MSMGTNAHLTSAQGLYVPNPTHIGSNGMDINSTITTTSTKFANGGVSQHDAISSYVQKLELKMYKQSIRIIELENKLDSEECENLKKMLESNDEASIILAKEIIDNLETA
jgi:hypothetical protein